MPPNRTPFSEWGALFNFAGGGLVHHEIFPEVFTLDGARVYNNEPLDIDSGVATALTFNSERYDNGDLHDPTTDPSRLTAKTAGIYVITGCIEWGDSDTGRRQLLIKLNATTFIASQTQRAVADEAVRQIQASLYALEVDDFVELFALQDSGITLAVQSSPNYSPEFAMQLITS